MSTRAVVVASLFGASLAAAITSGRQLFFNLTYLWGGLLLISFLWSRSSLSGVRLRRRSHASRAQVGHILREQITVSNQGRWPKLWLDVRDRTELPGFRATSMTGLGLFGPSDMLGHSGSGVVAGLWPGESRSWSSRTICMQRGRYPLGPTEIQGGDPFGLFPASMSVAAGQHVVVLPAIVPIREYPTLTGRLPGGEALRQRTHQVTPNASGVRDYQPGDSQNRIHWRSTAKRNRLVVKEFEFDPLADVWLVIDAASATQFHAQQDSDQGSKPWLARGLDAARELPPSTIEYGVTLAASLAFYFMEQDRGVGLIAHGRARHVVQPERGQSQLQRLLESLAVLEADGEHRLRHVLKIDGELMPRGATVILISADTDRGLVDVGQELLGSGRVPDYFLLDAHSFGGPPGSDDLQQGLRASGLRAWLIANGDDLAQALARRPQPTGLRVAS